MTSNSRGDFLDIARSWAEDPSAWTARPRFDPQQRWYHRMHEGDGYEVWLLTWLPGQETELHDHGGSAGAFTVVSGELTEFTPSATSPRLSTWTLRPGQGHRFGARFIHKVTNRGTEPAISVHAYGPALTIMRRYELTESGLRMANVEMAGAQW